MVGIPKGFQFDMPGIPKFGIPLSVLAVEAFDHMFFIISTLCSKSGIGLNILSSTKFIN